MSLCELEKTCWVSLEEGKQGKQASRLGDRIWDLTKAGVSTWELASYGNEALLSTPSPVLTDPGDHISLSIKAGESHIVSLPYLELKQGF